MAVSFAHPSKRFSAITKQYYKIYLAQSSMEKTALICFKRKTTIILMVMTILITTVTQIDNSKQS